MGGNAMQDFGARRVDADLAHRKAREVSQALDQVLAKHGCPRPCHVIRAYREKATFGDVDLLVHQEMVEAIGKELIVSELGALLGHDLPYFQVHPKASQFHTALPLEEGGALQIDFQMIPELTFEYAKDYFAWNDLSKLMQILGRSMSGLNFGVDGLSRSVKHKGQVIGRVTFTHDFTEALGFLGFDVERFNQGFDNLEAMYEFVVKHPNFNSSMYQWENRTSRGRGQDMDRPTYLGFLEWMKGRDLPLEAPADETDWVGKAYERFPAAHAEKDALFTELEDRQSLRVRFNGGIVSKLTGLRAEALGDFMKAYRKSEGEEVFVKKVLAMSDEDLHARISTYWAMYSTLPKPSFDEFSPS
ncbi:hypothetical protein [Pseudomonas amygdali]|uniref:Uncharacterized protein n=2 Tax=Pseudomonas amygdali pv. lachrymans TaxID=53707 RepID=A0AAD0V9D6_PSEAV|nr:hypothetical protein [Pseudomonas amygdali]AXH59783.1 hypothetical protein PLA107_031665 [Pseudomonas amygdali pv. lachrymans str. M301315]RMT06365.1 hypothetical protein ALP54_03677 [Pseudomonas amygdali pv. lachrymans]